MGVDAQCHAVAGMWQWLRYEVFSAFFFQSDNRSLQCCGLYYVGKVVSFRRQAWYVGCRMLRPSYDGKICHVCPNQEGWILMPRNNLHMYYVGPNPMNSYNKYTIP